MATVDLYDEEPEFGVERHADGDVELTIRADGTRIRITIGRWYDNASLLGESLRHLAEDVADNIVERWEDLPDEADAYLSVHDGQYHVRLDGIQVGDYPSQTIAEIEMARAMAHHGVFPPAWLVNDHGIVCDINEHIRRWHNAGGDGMAPIEGVQYRPGDAVWYGERDWPYRVVGDWGAAGVELHTLDDPSIRLHVTDRTGLLPVLGS